MELKNILNPSDVARYYLARALNDGDLITPLKIQKLIYYAYARVYVKLRRKLFLEGIQAWPNGPVVPSLYRELKSYGSMPISEGYLGDVSALESLISGSGMKPLLDEVYEEYIQKSAFELVTMTHSEQPWLEGREGKTATEPSNTVIDDNTILAFYS